MHIDPRSVTPAKPTTSGEGPARSCSGAEELLDTAAAVKFAVAREGNTDVSVIELPGMTKSVTSP